MNEVAALLQALQERCIRRGAFVLASGLTGSYYCDTKQVALHPRWADVIGRLLLSPILQAGAMSDDSTRR